MTIETLFIPEENLREVILIIRAGISMVTSNKLDVLNSTIRILDNWCNEEEWYLNDNARDDSKYDWSDEFDYER